MVEVRKADVHLVDDAGLTYSTVELRDIGDLPEEERLQAEREMVQRGKTVFRERSRPGER
jgi:hypothetical protein